MTITNILENITSGSLKIVDLTNTLSPSTPTLELPCAGMTHLLI